MQYDHGVKLDRLYKTQTTLGLDPGICLHLLLKLLLSFFSHLLIFGLVSVFCSFSLFSMLLSRSDQHKN